MPVSIVSNVASQYAQNAIQQRNGQVVASTQRLSSGQRVFGAAEDAAALAVGSSLRIENAALAKARLNATGGVSMLQVADGALGQVQDVLVRMKTLATQASSGNVSDAERLIIQQEFAALRAEVDRIALDTEFNGVKLLAGAPRFTYTEAHSLGSYGMAAAVDTNTVSADAVFRTRYDSSTEVLTVYRIEGGTTSSQAIDMTALLNGVAGIGQNLSGTETVQAVFNTVGLTVTLNAGFDRTADQLDAITDNTNANITFTTPVFTPAAANVGVDAVDGLVANAGPAYSPTTGNITLGVTSAGGAVTLDGIAGIRFGVNGGPAGASGAASADLVGATTFEIYVDNATAGTTLLGQVTLGGVSTLGNDTGSLVLPLGQGLLAADYQDLTGPRVLTYMVGDSVVQGQDLVTATISASTALALEVDTLAVTTVNEANNAISYLNLALTTINQNRAEVGAQQVRLEQVSAGLAVRLENNEIARSALLDVDVAAEITNLSNNNAMLEVGVRMLSESNRLPQMLLQLLRDG